MPEFFQTPMGHRFYESTMPRIATALETIAEKLQEPDEQLVQLLSDVHNTLLLPKFGDVYKSSALFERVQKVLKDA